MNLNALKDLKKNLKEQKYQLSSRIGKLEHKIKRKDAPLPQDFADQAVEMENDGVIDHLGVIERQELAKIVAAITRIENGTYGVCLQCGGNIDEKRLVAVPTATTCRTCMEELDE